MLDDFLLQFFDDQPRRATSVYLLLTGKKTLSVLFAALQHHQLQWLHLYPTLSRRDFQAAIDHLLAGHQLVNVDDGLIAGDQKQQPAVDLPDAYQPWMGVQAFEAKFHLAVQMLSEASFHNARYRPVTQDWALQQQLRQWWQTVNVETAIAELKTLLEGLGDVTAEILLSGVIGHEFVGSGEFNEWQQLQALSQLIAIIDQGAAPSWQRLWGGRKPLGTKTQYLALQMIQQGATREQAARRLQLKPSTINEHLLTAVIFGADLPLPQIYPEAMTRALSDVNPQTHYQTLLAQIPNSDFFEIRLFQILSLQGRWPHG
ncbi:helix-turn-helix domain-containing protein [Lacticaseibacillus porcinae]|uniref:helix-turn-helix domain-containing protein n=1 Tax=Lacticaseibacillus porcinae TaxID=1123687 RepID=UPI000F778ED2|nr:helix-turn-helix domain-containing protein [Lacticaseibacillus porcinae]